MASPYNWAELALNQISQQADRNDNDFGNALKVIFQGQERSAQRAISQQNANTQAENAQTTAENALYTHFYPAEAVSDYSKSKLQPIQGELLQGAPKGTQWFPKVAVDFHEKQLTTQNTIAEKKIADDLAFSKEYTDVANVPKKYLSQIDPATYIPKNGRNYVQNQLISQFQGGERINQGNVKINISRENADNRANQAKTPRFTPAERIKAASKLGGLDASWDGIESEAAKQAMVKKAQSKMNPIDTEKEKAIIREELKSKWRKDAGEALAAQGEILGIGQEAVDNFYTTAKVQQDDDSDDIKSKLTSALNAYEKGGLLKKGTNEYNYFNQIIKYARR